VDTSTIHRNPLLDELDLVVVEVPGTLAFEGGTGTEEALKPGPSVSVSVGPGVSVGIGPDSFVSVGVSFSGGPSYSVSYPDQEMLAD
jgi:hypothetical protein